MTMANLTENPVYEAGIYRFETTDPVQGGPGGIDNLPTNQLANRTAWLKAQVEAILLEIAAVESGYATTASLAGHTGNTSNPHGTTAAQVGLGNVQNYGIASQAEAEAGAIDTKYMTPLRAKQAIAALVPQSSETVAGLIKRATGAEAQALIDSTRALTPASLAAAFGGANQSKSTAGYQKLPGGVIVQWGFVSYAGTLSPGAAATAYFAFPIAFPSACQAIVLTDGGTAVSIVYGASVSASGANVAFQNRTTGSVLNPGGFFLAIGY